MNSRTSLLRWSVVLALTVVVGCAEPARRGYPEPFFRPAPVPPPPKMVKREPPPTQIPDTSMPGMAGLPQGVMPPGGLKRQWRYIVIHHSATPSGGAQQFNLSHLARGWENGLGYDFVIGNGTDTPNGSIEVGPRWTKQIQGAHCKTSNNLYNEQGIGICLVGNFEQSRPTSAQMDSLARLVRFLANICNIPMSNIVTHGGVTHMTACPGRNFSLQFLKKTLNDLAYK